AVHEYRVARSSSQGRTAKTLLNVALSAHGLAQLGVDLSLVEDGFFLQPMGFSAATLGDVVDASGIPPDYVLGTTWQDTPDILLILGGETPEATKLVADELSAAASTADCAQSFIQFGSKLPGDIEHFGFRDGISQIALRGRLSSADDDYLS